MPVSPYHRAVVDGLVTCSDRAEEFGDRNCGDSGRRVIRGRTTGDWVEPFLNALCEGMAIGRAAKVARVGEAWVYRCRREDPEFRKAWHEAAAIGTRLLEYEAARRAYHGVDKPVFYKGAECGSIRTYSDTLLIFLLKARKPEVYREGPRVVVGGQTNITAQQAAIQLLNQTTIPDLPDLPEIGTPRVTTDIETIPTREGADGGGQQTAQDGPGGRPG